MPFAYCQLSADVRISFNRPDNNGPESAEPSHQESVDEAYQEN